MQEQTHPISRAEFATSLKAAIRSSGLTYAAAAEKVNESLPPDMQVSAMSMWHYGNGKAVPRRLMVYQRICAVFSIGPFGASLAEAWADFEDSSHSPSSSGETDSGDEVRLVLENRGDGSAFLLFKGTMDWETALKAARILCDAGVASPEPADAR